MKILFFLPARSGSKGVKDKNIKNLNGKPLLAYVIEAIKNSDSFKHHECYIMLNTDSEDYAIIGREFGSKTPYLRPEHLSKDTSIITETIKHTMNYFEDKVCFDIFAFIQVTSPFITSRDIDQAVNLIISDSAIDAINSVTEVETNPLWCNTLDSTLRMDNFIADSIKKKNRQELPIYYKITGAIRMARWNKLKENEFDWYKNSKAIILEQSHSLDIDTLEDFMYAEFLMERREIKC